MTINETALNQLLERAVVDIGGTYHTALAVIGDKLGLYKALAAAGPQTPAELAAATKTAERYIREWLNANAAGGYITYDADTGRYSLSLEQTLVLADESSPAFILGGFQAALAATKSEPKIAEAFRSGAGVGWHEHDHQLFHGIERFFGAGYAANLVQSWIPALDGVEAKLHAGATVADIGCGHGASTILMAQAFPNSSFVGFDYHAESIAAARQRAEAAGVADRVRFEVATATNYPGANYDLVAMFDALHDMGNPAGAAAHVYSTLKADGTWLMVEPFAGDRVEHNLHPLGRAFYASSTLLCTPNALNQDAGTALGAQAGEAQLREVVMQGGFTRFRQAATSPVNLVLEARP
ncbi:MAG TPA: methyltransferase domain-containing protein [Roseiflexaceae bacterium]|nr:methyltransferase domain-containing protein [Roseiflexaceae bacterium]